jgi:hypothetical protein
LKAANVPAGVTAGDYIVELLGFASGDTKHADESNYSFPFHFKVP